MVLIDDIDNLLPQTQCGECGYASCLPYAEALAEGKASINCCPPGGVNTLKALSELFNVDATPYVDAAKLNTRHPSVAFIQETECIGCTKCIQACPVDAIVGSAKMMHTIIKHECTGCGLCVEPCPVDCIEMLACVEPMYDKGRARQRYKERQARFANKTKEEKRLYDEKRTFQSIENKTTQDINAKKTYIIEALARVKAKKGNE